MQDEPIEKPTEKVIIALDNIKSFKDFEKTVIDLKDYVWGFKIGLELINDLNNLHIYLNFLKQNNLKVFYDAKLHDIPNTVGSAVKKILQLKVDILTVHASGGFEMLQSAVMNKGKLKIYAVTILTSLDEKNCKKIYGKSVKEKVLELAKIAEKAGVDGIICSPLDLKFLKKDKIIKNMKFITPGIRPTLGDNKDQRRFATPKIAIQNGAYKLVIGRPITESKNPVKTLQQILKEISI